jgi:hypothetical protein
VQIGGCDRCIPRERSNLVFNGWIWSSLRRFRRRFSHSRAQHVRMSSLQAKCASFEVCFVKLPWNWPCPLAVLTCCSTQTAHRLPTDCPVHRNPQRLREVRYRHACSPYPQRLGRTHCLLVTNQDASVSPPDRHVIDGTVFEAPRCAASVDRKVSLGYMSQSESHRNWLCAVAECPGASPWEKDAVQTGQPRASDAHLTYSRSSPAGQAVDGAP